MRILAVSSRYRLRAGEDRSFDSAVALLRGRGHEVIEFVRTAADLATANRLSQAARVTWNRATGADLAERVRAIRPDVAFVGPYFPALSASAFDALARARVPLVLSVQNYRLRCVNGLLYRDGTMCRVCVDHRSIPVAAVAHRCYHGSVGASTVGVASMLALRRVLHRYPGGTTFAAVSDHIRRFLVEDVGVPPHRVHVKPNTLQVVPEPNWQPDDFVLFAGRLEPEKGVREAVDAVRSIPDARLVVVGTGSLANELTHASMPERIKFVGARPHSEVIELMSRARVTVANSLWAEPFGRVAVESLACGTPVIAGDRGGLPEIVEHGASGLVIPPQNRVGLRTAIHTVLGDSYWATAGRRAARARFDDHFSPALVGRRLEEILSSAATERH